MNGNEVTGVHKGRQPIVNDDGTTDFSPCGELNIALKYVKAGWGEQ